jgi:hypothetical protein
VLALSLALTSPASKAARCTRDLIKSEALVEKKKKKKKKRKAEKKKAIAAIPTSAAPSAVTPAAVHSPTTVQVTDTMNFKDQLKHLLSDSTSRKELFPVQEEVQRELKQVQQRLANVESALMMNREVANYVDKVLASI